MLFDDEVLSCQHTTLLTHRLQVRQRYDNGEDVSGQAQQQQQQHGFPGGFGGFPGGGNFHFKFN